MSEYDNPRIINDQSAMAWANAAAKLSETMVQSIQNMVKFRQQQKAVANEKIVNISAALVTGLLHSA